MQLFPEEEERLAKINELGMAAIPEDHLALELSYARYRDPKVPAERQEKGLISSGVRQICYFLGLKLTPEDEEIKASVKPLLKPKLTITAYTDPENYPSERVLEKAGFKKIGTIKYEEESEKLDNLWILDWAELANLFARKDEERVAKKGLKTERPLPKSSDFLLEKEV